MRINLASLDHDSSSQEFYEHYTKQESSFHLLATNTLSANICSLLIRTSKDRESQPQRAESRNVHDLKFILAPAGKSGMSQETLDHSKERVVLGGVYWGGMGVGKHWDCRRQKWVP